MHIVIKKRKYRLRKRNQYVATIYHWNGNALFRTTESYDNKADLYAALENLFNNNIPWTVKDEDGVEAKFHNRMDLGLFFLDKRRKSTKYPDDLL